MAPPRIPAEERFDRQVKRHESGCWLWTGAPNTYGYGQLKVDGRFMVAHRFSYLRYKGQIPPGLVVCHSCDIRNCVNPDHLFLGTVADNNADMRSKGRAVFPTGEHHGQAKLSWGNVKDIRQLYASGATKYSIAKQFGVGFMTIYNVVNDITWKSCNETNESAAA